MTPDAPFEFPTASDPDDDLAEADPLGGAPDCGNGCDGPAGHAEGCPVHCHCHDAVELAGDDTDGLGDQIVLEDLDTLDEPDDPLDH